MSVKIEGTMRLEGLIEGPMPPFPDAREKVEKWAAGFARGAVRMSVQFDGNHFSALPANEFVAVESISREGLEPANAIADGLADLLRYFPPLERSQVFSTIRSVEYRAGQEVQTLYAVGPEGRIATRQQTVAATTAKTAEPISPREMIKRGIMGLILAAGILGISSFFVDYRGMWLQLTSHVEPTTATVDAGSFAPYFSVKVTGLDMRNGTLLLKVTRTAAYPTTEAALDGLYDKPLAPAPPVLPVPTPAPAATATASAIAPASAPASQPEALSLVRRRVAVESLAKGSVWLDFYDASGKVIGGAVLRLDGLDKVAEMEKVVPAPVVKGRAVAPASVRIVAE